MIAKNKTPLSVPEKLGDETTLEPSGNSG